MRKLKVGLVGCGNIASDLCIAIGKGDIPAEIVALCDVDRQAAENLKATYALEAPVCSLDEAAAKAELLVECASPDAAGQVVDAAIRFQVDCLILSIGGLLERPELIAEANAHGARVHLPSGALAGLDGLRAAKEGGVDSVTLTTRKPPKGLQGAPYLEERGIDVSNLSEPLTVFEGTAREACRAFPKNVNVAAALSLAGIGPDKTQVRVVADPGATLNAHEIVVEGAFGRLTARTENRPSPRNPKSSYMASLSAVAELRAAAEDFAARR